MERLVNAALLKLAKLLPERLQSKGIKEVVENDRLEKLWHSRKPSDVKRARTDFRKIIDSNPDMPSGLRVLLERINELGFSEPDWKYRLDIPVVSIEEFFGDNTDESSIGTNLDPHPGLNYFEEKLKEIREHPSTQDVLLDIFHVQCFGNDVPARPGAESAYIITSAPDSIVENWNGELLADGPSEGWIDGIVPNGAPVVRDSYRIWRIMWD